MNAIRVETLPNVHADSDASIFEGELGWNFWACEGRICLGANFIKACAYSSYVLENQEPILQLPNLQQQQQQSVVG
jgi:hypothetical protein